MGSERNWKNLDLPGSFSSAEYLARAQHKKAKTVKKELEKSALYQAHRDLRETFPKRSVYATRENYLWETDLGDLGGQVPPEVSGQPVRPGRRKQLQMLVVIDAFTRKIYARGLLNKTSEEVAKAMRHIIRDAGSACERLNSDDGTEFKGRPMRALCKEFGIHHTFAFGQHKSSMAEMAVKQMKRVVMAAVQTDSWPPGKGWPEVPEIAAASLRRRYNRGLKAVPADISKDPKLRQRLFKEEESNAKLTSPKKYREDQEKIMSGGAFHDGPKEFKLGDPVLLPIPKVTRLKRKDKNHMMHYSLMPAVVAQIYHGRSPAMYAVKNARTGKAYKRHYYARELKRLHLPADVDPADIKGYKVVRGAVEYNVSGRASPLRLP